MTKITLLFSIFALLAGSMPPFSIAQTTTQAPTEAERRISEANADKAEYEAALKAQDLRAKKLDIRKTELEMLSLTPGAASAKDMKIEPSIMAYEALRCSAKKVWVRIESLGAKNLVVYDPGSADSVSAYIVFADDLNNVNLEYKELLDRLEIKEKKDDAKDAVMGIITIVAAAVSLLKTDVTLEGVSVDQTTQELIAALVNERPAATPAVYFPQRMIPTNIEKSEIVIAIKTAMANYQLTQRHDEGIFQLYEKVTLRDQKQKRLDDDGNGYRLTYAERADLKAAIYKLELEIVTLKKDFTVSEDIIKENVPTLIKVNAKYKALVNRIGAGEGGRATANLSLAELLKAEMIFKLFKKEKTYWIDANVAQAGGTVKTTNGALKSIFAPGMSRFQFSGGVIISFLVLDSAGQIKSSGIESVYKPFEKASKFETFAASKGKCPVSITTSSN